MADAAVSNTAEGNLVRVRIPASAPPFGATARRARGRRGPPGAPIGRLSASARSASRWLGLRNDPRRRVPSGVASCLVRTSTSRGGSSRCRCARRRCKPRSAAAGTVAFQEIDVRPQEVLDSDQVAGRELEDQKLVRRSAVGKTGSSGKRRQSLTWRRADFPRRVGQRPHCTSSQPVSIGPVTPRLRDSGQRSHQQTLAIATITTSRRVRCFIASTLPSPRAPDARRAPIAATFDAEDLAPRSRLGRWRVRA